LIVATRIVALVVAKLKGLRKVYGLVPNNHRKWWHSGKQFGQFFFAQFAGNV
jgi:hypothetical protein